MKRFLVILLIIALAVTAVSCGQKDKGDDNGTTNPVDSDTETTAAPVFEIPDLKIAVDYMVTRLEMTDMTEIEGDNIAVRYGIVDKYTDAAAIVSATISSDECVIFKAVSEEAAEEIIELLKTYRDDQIELYNGYAPEETPKLESAFIRAKNGYVIFVTTTEPVNAEEIWENMSDELGG